jgi:broad specificity phosphatase PhoE
MQLIVIRHAQSSNNSLQESAECSTRAYFEKMRSHDAPLSKLGEDQIGELASGVERAFRKPLSHKIRAVRKKSADTFCPRVRVAVSPMQRALLTAVPVIKAVEGLHSSENVKFDGIDVVPYIHEVGGCYNEMDGRFVGFPGLDIEGVRAIIPKAIVCESMAQGWWKSSTRETEEELEARITQTIEWIRLCAWKNEVDVLILVTHQDFACNVMRRLVQAPGLNWLYNTSLSSLTLEPILDSWNGDSEALPETSDSTLAGVHHCRVTIDWLNSIDHLSAHNIS